MERRPVSSLLVIACAFATLAGCAAVPESSRETGYLAASRADVLAGDMVPQDPARRMPDVVEGGDRWLLATVHAELRPRHALQHFDCALGVRSASGQTQALERALARAFSDVGQVADRLKAAAPATAAADGRACRRRTMDTGETRSRPPRETLVGAAYAELLAAAAPDAAPAIRRVGHEIGVSQAICGVAAPDEVLQGERLGRRLGLEIVATAAFQSDLPDLRREVQALRRSGLTHPGCAAERLALSEPAL